MHRSRRVRRLCRTHPLPRQGQRGGGCWPRDLADPLARWKVRRVPGVPHQGASPRSRRARMQRRKPLHQRLSARIGAPGFEPGTSPTRTVRATRLRHAPRAPSIANARVSGIAEPYEGPAPDTPVGRRASRSRWPGIAAAGGPRARWSSRCATGVGDALSGDTGALREELRDLGFGGALIVLALALVHTRRLVPGRDPRRRRRLRLRLLGRRCRWSWSAGWLNGVVACWIGPPRRAAAALPLARRASASTGSSAPSQRGGVTLLLGDAPGPGHPLQPLLARRRRGPGAARALPLDDGGRLPAADGALRLPRQPARGALPRPTRCSGSARWS